MIVPENPFMLGSKGQRSRSQRLFRSLHSIAVETAYVSCAGCTLLQCPAARAVPVKLGFCCVTSHCLLAAVCWVFPGMRFCTLVSVRFF